MIKGPVLPLMLLTLASIFLFFPAEPAFGVGSHSSALCVEYIVGKYG